MTTTERHRPAAEPTEAEAADQVIHAVSHDLMGPLLNIRGFLGRLRQGCGSLGALAADWPLQPEQREAWHKILDDRVLRSVEILDQSAHRLQRRITALLELSRAGAGPVRLESVSAEALARAVAEELTGEAEKRGAKLEVGPAPQVTADAGRLTAILRRLFLNALHFLAPSRAGAVHFGGRLQDGEAWLWVRDNGIGLRAEDGERVFQPFGRVQEVDSPGEGTGLATVRKLLRQQGGCIWVESTHGAGSTFYLALPRAG